MRARIVPVSVAASGLLLGAAVGVSAAPGDPGSPRFGPGADGAGDPYFPLSGNGGYDVTHYDLALDYEPPGPEPAPLEGALDAVATISITPTQDLDQFNLDLRGLDVESVVIRGRPMRFTHDGDELVVTPRPKLRAGHPVDVVVTYGGTTGRDRKSVV